MASQADIDLLMAYGMRYERGLRMPTHSAAGALQTAGYGLLRRLLFNPRRIKRAVEKARFAWIERQIRRQDYLITNPISCRCLTKAPPSSPCMISCFDHPETHPAERVEIMHRELPPAIERVDHIIVISGGHSPRAGAAFWCAGRMTVTLLAAHPNFAPRPAASLQAAPFAGLAARRLSAQRG